MSDKQVAPPATPYGAAITLEQAKKVMAAADSLRAIFTMCLDMEMNATND